MLCNRTLFYLITLTLILSPVAQIAIAQSRQDLLASPVPDGSVQYELYQKYLGRMSMFMRDIRANVDRTAFDFDALLDSLNYDAEEIIAFSKNAIAFEQYSGVLRGPLGTLFSRAGNSIDQSLLLAKLLRDAGYEARLAGTELNADQASAVLQAMKQPVSPAPPIGNAEKFLDVMERYGLVNSTITGEQIAAYADYVAAPPAASETSIFDSVIVASNFITKQLDKHGSQPDSSSAQSELVSEARQYFWVQYKDGASDSWENIHPVFTHKLPFEKPKAETFISEEVPEVLQHRVRVQAFIERKVGDRLEIVPITSPWERPVANLIGVPLTYSNMADSMLTERSFGTDLETISASAKTFVPTFGSSLAPGAMFFDLRGTVIDPMAATNSAAGLFATISDSFGDAIGNIGDEDSIPILTSHWMEIVLISPGGDEKVFRRTTFDRIGAAARESNKVPANLEPTSIENAPTLLQQQTIMIAGGVVPRGYVIDAAVDRFERSRPGINALLDVRYDQPARARSLSNIPVGWSNHLALFSMFNIATTIGPTHRNYRSGPALVIHSSGLSGDRKLFESIDIVSNPRRALNINGVRPELDPEYATKAGVWETAVEGSLLSGDSHFSTWKAFEIAREAGVVPIVILPGQTERLAELSADTIAAINADLNRGYAVIVPDMAVVRESSGWWRINLRTGETLGQISDGRGSELVKYAALTISFAAFSYGIYGCLGYSGDAGWCCQAANAGMYASTIAIGLVGPVSILASITLDANRVVVGAPAAEVCDAVFGE